MPISRTRAVSNLPMVVAMDSKRVFPGAGPLRRCDDDGGGAPAGGRDVHGARRRPDRPDKESIPGSGNFRCPDVPRRPLFFPPRNSHFLPMPPFLPIPQWPLSVDFRRSYSETCVVEMGNYSSNMDFRNSSRVSATMRTSSVQAMRRWELTSFGTLQERRGKKTFPGTVFSVVSYNVLAQELLEQHPELYADHDKHALRWDFRWRNLLQELRRHDADILCLQEVQSSHVDQYLNKLKSLGYSTLYKKRTGFRSDGCAICYKHDKFQLTESASVEYRQPDVAVLDRDNVGLVATLAPRSRPAAQFVVATTHLLYNPRRQDVRLAQTQVLMAEVERFAYRKGADASAGSYVPVIITGDFNSDPSSGIYEYLTEGRFEYENATLRSGRRSGKLLLPRFLCITDCSQHSGVVDTRERSGSVPSREEELKLIRLVNSDFQNDAEPRRDDCVAEHTFSSGTISHKFDLTSVYKHKSNDDAEGTTYQDEWVTVDYIFYSGNKGNNSKFKEGDLKLLSKYTLPTKEKLRDIRIPNFELGSDHLLLSATFKLEYN